MCDPMSAIGFGLQAAGMVAEHQGQQRQVDAHNAAAAQNAINASLAGQRQYEDEDRRLIYDNRMAMREGYQAVKQARQAQGTARASTGTAGFDMASVSVNNILSSLASEEGDARFTSVLRSKDLQAARDSRVRSHEAQAQGRINSMPMKQGPSGAALGLGIATAGFGAFKNSPTGKNWLGT